MLCTGLPLRVVPIRFVLTLSLVCNRNFQSLGLRKHHQGESSHLYTTQAPALLGNEARIKASGALGLVNPNLQSFRLPSSDLQVGVVDKLPL